MRLVDDALSGDTVRLRYFTRVVSMFVYVRDGILLPMARTALVPGSRLTLPGSRMARCPKADREATEAMGSRRYVIKKTEAANPVIVQSIARDPEY